MKNKIKCVVWDLDNTIWHGVLLEDKEVHLNDDVTKVIKDLDKKGILQSIASKNNCDMALKKLDEFGIKEYFLYPQINWEPKYTSVKEISILLNIPLDSFAFVDDQNYEIEEMKYFLPNVNGILTNNLFDELKTDRFNIEFITDETKKRRILYQTDNIRKMEEKNFKGTQEDFLRSLQMELTISKMTEADLCRVSELTVRTHQLNSTGYTYSFETLKNMLNLPQYMILVIELDDKYGTYGKIGIALLELKEEVWIIKLLLMSCRVMSRGIRSPFLTYLKRLAKNNNVRLQAEFVFTDKNRQMYITYRFSGFNEIEVNDKNVILEANLINIEKYPDYITMNSFYD